MTYNMLVGSWDLSTVSWGDKATRSGEKFHGAAVAELNAGQWGVQFPTSAHRADARVTSGAEYVLSFWARADVDGDKIHSEVWGSLYMLDATLTTEWQQVVMPYGIRKADERRVYFWGLGTNSGNVHLALPMCVRGATPAAWAPADGETLAGGGAQMSANLLDGVTPTLAYGSMADGVITSSTPKDNWKNVAAWPITSEAFAKNQTMHIGISAKWHGTAATKGIVYAAVKYANAAGDVNTIDIPITGITTEWKRFSLSAVVPSGMHLVDFHFSGDKLDAAYDATSFVLSYGSPLVLAIASSTLAWSAGILATVRYYQLAAPTAATPTVPTSSSSLGSWSETEPTADVTKVLWTCERTVYADGTESWSKASKSTSYEAAKDAKSTATDAQQRAVAISTLVRETDAGVEVGKTADGTTYATGRTLQTADVFKVLDKAGNVLSSFGANLIELGKNSFDAAIRMLGGLATMEATKLNDVTGLLIASDAVDVVASGGGGARLFSSFGKVSNHTAVWSALASELPTLYAECTDLSANGEEVVTNKVAMTPLGFELSRPDAMRSALGLGFTQLYYDYDAGWVVYASDYLVWIYAWGVGIGSGSWDSKTCPYVLPEKYRPRLYHITTPTSVNNGGSWTSVMSVNSQGQISVKNYGNAGSTDARYGVLLYPVGV